MMFFARSPSGYLSVSFFSFSVLFYQNNNCFTVFFFLLFVVCGGWFSKFSTALTSHQFLCLRASVSFWQGVKGISLNSFTFYFFLSAGVVEVKPRRMASTSMLAVCLVLLCAVLARGNVIGIDFGSDTMKVAIVQPGTPLEIGKSRSLG
jgi:hypothetical protein